MRFDDAINAAQQIEVGRIVLERDRLAGVGDKLNGLGNGDDVVGTRDILGIGIILKSRECADRHPEARDRARARDDDAV
jgi:hypothetical protein